MYDFEPLYIVILATSISILLYYFSNCFEKIAKLFSLLLISFSIIFLAFYYFTPIDSNFNIQMKNLNTKIIANIK